MISSKNNGFPKVITGIRHCGKSYILKEVYRKNLVENGVEESSILVVELDDDINAMYRDPIELAKYEGKVDFNNEDFKKACEFANSHFPEKSDRDSMFSIVIGGSSESLDAPQQMDLSVPSIIMSQLGGTPETVGFYGFPAAEEHGPVAYINSSAAISTGISDETKDACWDLIKIMLDDEVQESIKDSFPINRSAMSNLLVSMADDADKSYNTYVKMGYSETEIVTQFNTVKVNRDIIDSFYNSVENITDVSRSNSSLDIVIAEELPAYFAGQKGLDDVISIINDRAQTIYDERK